MIDCGKRSVVTSAKLQIAAIRGPIPCVGTVGKSESENARIDYANVVDSFVHFWLLLKSDQNTAEQAITNKLKNNVGNQTCDTDDDQ